MTSHPQHAHPLHLSDPLLLYAEFRGEWRCDNCEITYNSTHKPHHCASCSYDLCKTCFQAKQHPRHNHNLYLTKTADIYKQYNGQWKCDVCRNTKGPPLEPMVYHCFQDEFDLCKDCFEGRKFQIHRHPLLPVDASIVYNNSTGDFTCDGCNGNKAFSGTQYPWHCFRCEFDFCNGCLEEVCITKHPHPLKMTDSYSLYADYDGCWQCDICSKNIDPKNPGNNGNTIPFHCFMCEFDACRKCVKQFEKKLGLEGDFAGPPKWAHKKNEGPSINSNHHPPEEI